MLLTDHTALSSARKVTPRHFRGVTFAIMALTALTTVSCSAPDNTNEAISYERPAWMAEQAQRQEEHRSQLQSCVSSKGWDVTITPEGGVEEPFTEADYARYEIDRTACRAEAGLDDGNNVRLDAARLGEIYDRQVDTWECLRAEGYPVAEPPSKELYVESSLAAQNGDSSVNGWWPYGDAVFEEMAEAEYNRLQAECPEPWWAE